MATTSSNPVPLASTPQPSLATKASPPPDILSLKVGGSRLNTTVIAVEHSPSDGKLLIHCRSSHERKFKCFEVWLLDRSGRVQWKRLYLNLDSTGTTILAGSHLAKLLSFYKVDSLGGLVGNEILLEPKPNGLLAIVAYE